MKILLGLVLMCGMISEVYAQEDGDILCHWPVLKPAPHLYIGLTGGFGRIFHTEGISNSLNINQNFDPIRSNSFFAGLNTEYILGEPKDSESSIILKAYYLNLTTSKSTFSESESIFLPDNQTSVLKTENLASFKASFINTELMYSRYLFSSAFTIGGGFGIVFPLSSSIEKRKEIREPEGLTLKTEDERYRTEQNGRALVFKEEDIATINYYAKIGFGFDMYNMFGSRLILSPSVFYNFGLNKATRTESFKINSLQFSLDLKIPFYF